MQVGFSDTPSLESGKGKVVWRFRTGAQQMTWEEMLSVMIDPITPSREIPEYRPCGLLG